MSEEWREVRPGIEVSSLGRVRVYVQGHRDSDGYPVISGGKRGAKKLRVHNLVAEAFLGPRPKGQVVRHLNDDKDDNSETNLAYGTRRHNYDDAVRNGRIDPCDQENAARLKAVASLGGQWWRGKKRDGVRGRVVP